MIDFRFIPLMKAKIFSSFNNARKSNVGISSSEVMQKIYRKKLADLYKLETAEVTKIDTIKHNIEEMNKKMSDTIEESVVTYSGLNSEIENAQTEEEKKEYKEDLQSEKDFYNQKIAELGNDMKKSKEKLDKTEKSLEKTRKKRNSILDKINSVDENTDGGLTREDILEENNLGDTVFLDETSTSGGVNLDDTMDLSETDVSGGRSVNDIEPSINEKNISEDPTIALQNAFNSFIEQYKLERKENQTASDSIIHLKQENKNLKDENQKLKEYATNREKEVKEISMVAEEIQKQAQEKIEKANGVIRKEKEEIKKLVDRVKSLEAENTKVNDENKKLKEENETLKIKNADVVSELKNAQSQFSKISQAIKDSNGNIESIGVAVDMSNIHPLQNENGGIQYTKNNN